MEFEYLEVKTQEHLDDLKLMGCVCINHILIEVPENIIVIAKLTFKESDPEYHEMLKHSASMDISNLSVTATTKILVIMQKPKKSELKDELTDEEVKKIIAMGDDIPTYTVTRQKENAV